MEDYRARHTIYASGHQAPSQRRRSTGPAQ
jgi:hypothetical protein